MSYQPKNKNLSIVLAGATGLVGGFCLKLLLESPSVEKVFAFTRRPLELENPKVKEVTVNFQQLSLLPQPKEVDTVFCCLGTTMKKAGSQDAFRQVDFESVVALAKWGLKHQAKQFLVVSSMGANTKSPIFYNKIKGEMEAEISQLGYPSVSIFRPSLLVGPRQETRVGEKLGEYLFKGLNPLLAGPLRKYQSIKAETVARAMVKTSMQPSPGVNIYLSDQIETIAG